MATTNQWQTIKTPQKDTDKRNKKINKEKSFRGNAEDWKCVEKYYSKGAIDELGAPNNIRQFAFQYQGMFFVETSNKINQKPNRKQNRKRDKMFDEYIHRRQSGKTDIEGNPKRKTKEKYVAEK